MLFKLTWTGPNGSGLTEVATASDALREYVNRQGSAAKMVIKDNLSRRISHSVLAGLHLGAQKLKYANSLSMPTGHKPNRPRYSNRTPGLKTACLMEDGSPSPLCKAASPRATGGADEVRGYWHKKERKHQIYAPRHHQRCDGAKTQGKGDQHHGFIRRIKCLALRDAPNNRSFSGP